MQQLQRTVAGRLRAFVLVKIEPTRYSYSRAESKA
jgi:hypothetical protein